MYNDQVFFYEESHYFQTMFDLVDLYREYGDRVFDDLEKHCPAVYEAFSAHMANKQIEEFISNIHEYDDCDYWKDEGEIND